MEPFVMILFPIHISSIPNENQRKKGKVVLTNSVTVGSLVTSCYCMKERGQTKSNKVKPFLYFSLWLTFYFKVFFYFCCASHLHRHNSLSSEYEVNIQQEMECIHISNILKGRRMLPCWKPTNLTWKYESMNVQKE